MENVIVYCIVFTAFLITVKHIMKVLSQGEDDERCTQCAFHSQLHKKSIDYNSR